MALPVAELLLGAYSLDETASRASRFGAGKRRDELLGARSVADARDAELVAQLRRGDGDAYEEAIRAYYAWLHAVAMSYVASPVIAEDIVDGAFERMWERHELLAPETRLAVYLFVSVRNASLDRLKHEAMAQRRLRQSVVADAPLGMGAAPERVDLHVEQDDVVATIWQAIESLSERARAIMVLRWREQREWAEIADALGMTLAAVQMQHSRALKQLRERLPEYLREL